MPKPVHLPSVRITSLQGYSAPQGYLVDLDYIPLVRGLPRGVEQRLIISADAFELRKMAALFSGMADRLDDEIQKSSL